MTQVTWQGLYVPVEKWDEFRRAQRRVNEFIATGNEEIELLVRDAIQNAGGRDE